MHTGESGRVNMSSFSSKCYYRIDNGFGPVEGYISFMIILKIQMLIAIRAIAKAGLVRVKLR